MRGLRVWLLRLRGVFRRRRDEQDFSEQLDADVALYVDERVRDGMTVPEARRAAALEFGSLESAREAWRDRHGVPGLERLHRDVIFAIRLLRRNKGWTVVGIVSLALGVGAGAAVFSSTAALLLRRMSVPQAADLVTLRWAGENKVMTSFADYGFVEDGLMASWFGGVVPGRVALATPDIDHMRAGASNAYDTFRRIQEANNTLDPVFALAPGPPVNMIVDGHGDLASTQFVSGEFFAGVRVPPAAGRPILPADDRAGAERIGVISDAYWQRRFARSSSVLGKQVRLNAVPFTIVGVAGANLPNVLSGQAGAPDILLPLHTEPSFQSATSRLEQPTNWWLVMMGRLKPGRTAAQVEANLGVVFDHAVRDAAGAFMRTLPPDDLADAKSFGFGEHVPRLHVVSGARGAYDPLPFLRTPLTILAVLAGIVLLIVCANLSNLSMALTTQRERELAVRRALGATRSRVTRQILTEHAVLAVLGGGLSCLAAYLFQHVLRVFLPTTFDWTVVAIAFVLALLSGMVIGLFAAIAVSRQSVTRANGLARARPRLAAALLVGQVAMSLVLLVGSGLFVRTLANLQKVDPGFDSANVLMFTLDPSTNQYDQTQASALFDRVATSLGTLPHVTAVTFSSQPLLRNAWSSKELHAQGAAPGTAAQSAYSIAVQEDFFTTMGIRILAGRAFDARDAANGPPVAILSATLAKRMFGDLNAVGRRFGVDDDATRKFEVVGVVADTRPVSLRTESPITVYWPHRQSPEGARTFLLRTSAAPEAMMPIIRKAMERIDPAMPLIDLSTQASAFDDQWVRERTTAVASGTLGLLALLVSMVGLFGLASYAVTRRSKEIAIRMAVGADAPGVLRSVLRDSLVLVAVGISIGLGLSVLTTRFLSTLLFGLTPNDPAVIAAAVLMMFVVASLAGYLPARRAARIDPITALREE